MPSFRCLEASGESKTNTELILIVTPEIVDPIPAGKPTPHLNYPAPFLPSDPKVAVNTPQASHPRSAMPLVPETLPVEQLIKSMHAEKPLVIDGNSSAALQPSSSSGP